MFALVESGSITKYFSGNRGIIIGDKQYPKAIFTLWSKAEREAIGIYEVEMDTSKRKDEEWYINTNVTYSFGSGKVTGAYGDATAKAHADTLFTAQDETDGLGTEGEVKTRGLKYNLIQNIKRQAALCVVIALGTAVPASAFLTTYQSVFCNSPAACLLIF